MVDVDRYLEQGFLVLRGVIPAPALDVLRRELDGALARSYGARRGAADHEQAALTMGPLTPRLAESLEQPILLDTARTLYGDDVLGVATYGTSHTGDTGWHADSPREHPRGVKFSLYLEPTGANSGALRVWPGSHRSPEHERARATCRGTTPNADLPATICATEPGDLVVFDLRLFHAALGGGGDRRAISSFYFAAPHGPEEERLLREQVIEDYQWLSDKNRGGRVFDPHWLSNPGRHPVRADWIERFRALGVLGDDPERGDLLEDVATPLPAAVEASLAGATAWPLLDGSVKADLLRARFSTPAGDVLLLVRPAAEPHPRYATRGTLAVGYSTLDCRPLTGARLAALDALVDAVGGLEGVIGAAIGGGGS